MKPQMRIKGIFILTLGFILTAVIPPSFAYSSKEAKEKVEAAEQGLQNARAADAKADKANDNWTKKDGQMRQDAANAEKKAEEAKTARQKADETGKQEDIKAAEKAEKIAKGAQKNAEESTKAAEEAKKKAEEARPAADEAKRKAAETVKPAEKAVGDLPESSVKEKLKERLKKVKEGLDQLALAPHPPGTVETAWGLLGFINFAKLDPQKVGSSLVGTKETIGPVAMLTLTNQTDETIQVRIPPTVLHSKSGRVQNYALPNPHEFTLGPRETRIFPLTGVCLDARVPPAGPDDKDELQILDPETPEFDSWAPLLSGAQAADTTAEELQKEGAYQTPYSKDPRKELDTIVQWTTWAFVSTVQGNPVTKEELGKKVYEQTGEVTEEQKEKLDQGIDDVWDCVQLTGLKAKLLPGETEKISGTEESAGPKKGGVLTTDVKPGASSPPAKTEPQKETEEEVFKRLGWVKDEKGRWRPPTKPKEPEPLRWEEVVDPETGKPGIRLGPDGKPVYEGDKGYDPAKEELEKQKSADERKKAKEQTDAEAKAKKEADRQAAEEKRKRDRENLEKRKKGDPAAWGEWLGANPGRQRLPGTRPGKFNYFDEHGKIVAENVDY